MCDKCQELDQKIQRYHHILEGVLDPQIAEGVGKLIEESGSRKGGASP
jgi:hypothetical protein